MRAGWPVVVERFRGGRADGPGDATGPLKRADRLGVINRARGDVGH
jgi:hypothetical protein